MSRKSAELSARRRQTPAKGSGSQEDWWCLDSQPCLGSGQFNRGPSCRAEKRSLRVQGLGKSRILGTQRGEIIFFVSQQTSLPHVTFLTYHVQGRQTPAAGRASPNFLACVVKLPCTDMALCLISLAFQTQSIVCKKVELKRNNCTVGDTC